MRVIALKGLFSERQITTFLNMMTLNEAGRVRITYTLIESVYTNRKLFDSINYIESFITACYSLMWKKLQSNAVIHLHGTPTIPVGMCSISQLLAALMHCGIEVRLLFFGYQAPTGASDEFTE